MERIKPYYDDGNVTLYNGDCCEIMPQLSDFDAVVTDPPYGIDAASGAKEKSRNNKKFDNKVIPPKEYTHSKWDVQTADAAIIQILDMQKPAIIFGGNYYKMPPTSCMLIWDKINGASNFADVEMAWTNLKGAARIYRHHWNGMMRAQEHGQRVYRYHPTQKPVAVMEWCISFLKTDGAILDPFAGSGSTLLAARNSGYKSIGIEQSKEYCDVIIERLKQQTLF